MQKSIDSLMLLLASFSGPKVSDILEQILITLRYIRKYSWTLAGTSASTSGNAFY